MNNQIAKLCLVLVVVLLMVLVSFRIITFELWSQVTYLRGTSLQDLNPLTHPHFLRYLLVLPLFKLSDFINVDVDYIYSFFCVFLLYFISNNSAKIAEYSVYFKKKSYVTNILALLFILTLSSFMNGRILFAMAGFSFIVCNTLKWDLGGSSFFKLFLYDFFGLFLCTVSTGTFLVAVIFILGWLLLSGKRKKNLTVYMTYLTSFIAISPLLVLFILKNLNFYGGGIIGFVNMLSHGAGVIFSLVEGVLLMQIGLILTLCATFSLWILKTIGSLRLVLLGFYAAIAGGAFGFSTLAVGAPIFCSFLLIIFLKSMDKLKITI